VSRILDRRDTDRLLWGFSFLFQHGQGGKTDMFTLTCCAKAVYTLDADTHIMFMKAGYLGQRMA
jgi:hypothetical protein